ncbi:cutinase family protein [Nocardia terpenica]|nr:cutinase family protein [Nocardia terpenica]
MPLLRKAGVIAVLVTLLGMAGVNVALAQQPNTAQNANCPALAVFGVQGTGESSPDADPKNDTGMLGLMFRPMMAAASGLIDRTYVPYEASFGGAVAGGPVPYEQSVDHAVGRLDQMVAGEAKRCPSTKFAGAGYSQGAHAMSMWAKKVGAGQGAVPADRVAGIVLLADPTRQPRSGVFPGKPGLHSPEPIPGTNGAEVSKITVTDPGLTGAGIAPLADTSEGYGSLSGRVADICAPGDLACDAPEHAPVAHLIANIAGQSTLDPNDPVAAISTVAQALATTTFKTVVPVINNDVQGKTLDQLSYTPQKTISQRLAEASDPRTPMPGVDDTLSALLKVGTIAFNATKTVVTKVFTPDTIAQLATVGLADPVGAAMTLGGKVASAVMELVPPATQSRWVNEAFTALKDNVTDNRDLFNISTLIKYSDTIAKHQGYASFSSSPSGQSALDVGARWFAAAAHDIAAGHGN